MGDGLGRALTVALLQILTPLAVIFLIGFTIVLFTMDFIFRRYKGRSLRSDPPSCLFTLMLSVLGGFLAIQVLFLLT